MALTFFDEARIFIRELAAFEDVSRKNVSPLGVGVVA
jgi:hypothetical protein